MCWVIRTIHIQHFRKGLLILFNNKKKAEENKPEEAKTTPETKEEEKKIFVSLITISIILYQL